MNTSAKTSDLIPHNGRFTTLNRANPTANAAVIKDGNSSQLAAIPTSSSRSGSRLN